MPVVDEIRERFRDVPGLRAAIEAIVDRRAVRGALPQQMTLDVHREVEFALAEVFSGRAVRRASSGRVVIDFRRARAASGSIDIDEILHAAIGRTPRDHRVERDRFVTSAITALRALGAHALSVAARAYLDAQLESARAGKGDYLAAVRRSGSDAARDEWRTMVALIDAAVANAEPVRLATFSAKVAGDSKWLTANPDRLRRLGLVLASWDPATRAGLVDAGLQLESGATARLALEARGIFRDEGSVTVMCFGPITYVKRGQRFDHVARHARMGEPCRLTLKQIREAQIDAGGARLVMVLENLTTFFEYVELVARKEVADEVVVASEGQATWAVVDLVRALGRCGPRVVHSGDLDRSGVLIARSLAERSGVPVELAAMDAGTHRRFAARGLRMSQEEAARLGALLESDAQDALGHDLLVEISRSGVWIEQERFSIEALGERSYL